MKEIWNGRNDRYWRNGKMGKIGWKGIHRKIGSMEECEDGEK